MTDQSKQVQATVPVDQSFPRGVLPTQAESQQEQLQQQHVDVHPEDSGHTLTGHRGAFVENYSRHINSSDGATLNFAVSSPRPKAILVGPQTDNMEIERPPYSMAEEEAILKGCIHQAEPGPSYVKHCQ